ncbi:MAG: hypothetical protein WBA59_10855 [Moheibacter sp.]
MKVYIFRILWVAFFALYAIPSVKAQDRVAELLDSLAAEKNEEKILNLNLNLNPKFLGNRDFHFL